MAAKRKTTAKKVTRKSTKTSEKPETLELSEEKKESPKPIFTNRRLYLLALVLGIGGLLYLGRGLFIAAMVNGSPVTRLEVIRELEKQGGTEALDSLVTKKLIFKEAQQRGVTVTDEEVSGEIDELRGNLESQGQTLEAALEMQGQTMDSLNETIRITKLIEKMFENEVQVSDEEARNNFDQNTELYGEAEFDTVKPQIVDQLKQQKLFEAYRDWLAQERTDSRINYFVTY